jgi:hypothetical protein
VLERSSDRFVVPLGRDYERPDMLAKCGLGGHRLIDFECFGDELRLDPTASQEGAELVDLRRTHRQPGFEISDLVRKPFALARQLIMFPLTGERISGRLRDGLVVERLASCGDRSSRVLDGLACERELLGR